MTTQLNIRIGGKYRTRDGRVATITGTYDRRSSEWAFSGHVEGRDLGTEYWRADGTWGPFRDLEHDLDLVAEETVTKGNGLRELSAPAPAPAPVVGDTGYRYLEWGETILEGDEVGDDKGNWQKVSRFPIECRLPGKFRRAAHAPTPESRIADLESRVAVLEGLVAKPPAVPEPALVLRVGGTYRTRDGSTVRIEKVHVTSEWPYRGKVVSSAAHPRRVNNWFSWRPDGSYAFIGGVEDGLDLIEEIVEEGEPEYPTTPPDPGAGYRLLEKGDPIIRGKAEAWHPDKGWDLGPVRGWDGDTFDPETDYWFREPVPPTVDPGEGYRLVERGELIEEGDEWWEDESWKPTRLGGSGSTLNIDTPLRRRIKPLVDPGEGYELLSPGDIVREGDEVLVGCTWQRREAFGGALTKDHNPHRRPIRYRLLVPGEVIREGDEVWIDGIESSRWEAFDPCCYGQPRKSGPNIPPARRREDS